MKTNENQKSTNHSPTAQKPFFGAGTEHAFFSAERAPSTPFFQPKAVWQPTQQAKSATSEAEGITQPLVQRMPAFESELIAQRTEQRSPSPGQLPQPLQAKLSIGQPNDQYEQEADRVASQVVEQIHAPAPPLSGDVQSVQRMGEEEEQMPMMPKLDTVQRMGEEEEEMANNSPQAKQTAQLQAIAANHPAQQQQPSQKKASPEPGRSENNTGLPENLKSGIENLSGYSMDDVKVHYNSDKPSKLQAHAYTQGTDIHVASGEEKHLPHEAWHVVQQKQGRVKPTKQMKGKVNVNEDAGLEKEADVMGAKTLSEGLRVSKTLLKKAQVKEDVAQAVLYQYERATEPLTQDQLNDIKSKGDNKVSDIELQNAFDDVDNSYYLDIRGSLTGSRGFGVASINKFIPTSSFSVGRKGNLKLEPDSSALGWKFSGRPSWSEYIMKTVKTIKGQDNIRHIIPYHMIRDSFIDYLNSQVSAVTNDDFLGVINNLTEIAKAIGTDLSAHTEPAKFIIEQSMKIITTLNSAPGNLWAGSAEENQRLNTFRIRLEGVGEEVKSLSDQRAAGQTALNMLNVSLKGAGGQIYKGLIQGAIDLLPKENTPIFYDRETIIDRLKLAWNHCEIDAMPSIKELRRLDEEQLFSNFPQLATVITYMKQGNFPVAAITLMKLKSPHD